MKKETLKKIAKPFIFPLAVAIVAWEELFYKPIKYVSNYLERNQVIHKVSDKIRNSNPFVALAILACCGLPLIPFKIAGLYLVGHGYTLLGLGTFGLAKVVGGAISVHIFNLTEPAIRKIKMVNTGLDWTFDKKNKIKKVVTDSPHFIALQNNIREVKSNIKQFVTQNSYFAKVNAMFKRNTPIADTTNMIEVNKIETTVETKVETTIVERITAKVELMSHSVASFIDQPQVVVVSQVTEVTEITTTVETVETEVFIKKDNPHFISVGQEKSKDKTM